MIDGEQETAIHSIAQNTGAQKGKTAAPPHTPRRQERPKRIFYISKGKM